MMKGQDKLQMVLMEQNEKNSIREQKKKGGNPSEKKNRDGRSE